MDWIKLVIPLIAVAVWILSNLAKNRDETRRQRTAPPPKPEDGMGPARRRTPAEVDKFLEEVRRRREALEGKLKKPLSPPPAPVPLAQTVPEFPRARTIPPPLPMPPPPRPEIRRSSVSEPVMAKLVPTPAPEPEVVVPAAPRVTALPSSPQVRQTLALLRDRKTLVTVMLLREILDQPLCKRMGSIPAHRK